MWEEEDLQSGTSWGWSSTSWRRTGRWWDYPETPRMLTNRVECYTGNPGYSKNFSPQIQKVGQVNFFQGAEKVHHTSVELQDPSTMAIQPLRGKQADVSVPQRCSAQCEQLRGTSQVQANSQPSAGSPNRSQKNMPYSSLVVASKGLVVAKKTLPRFQYLPRLQSTPLVG